MADRIENKDLFAGDLFAKTIEDVKGLISELDSLDKKIVQVAQNQKKILSQSDNTTLKGVQQTKAAIDSLNKAEKTSETIRKNKLALEQKLKVAVSDNVQQNEELKVLLSEQNKINKQLAREKLNLVSAYDKESKRLNDLRKKYKDLALTEGESSKKARELLKEITALDTKLKGVDASVGQYQRNVGNYGAAWGKVGNILKQGLGILGITSAVAILGNAVKGAFNTVKEFDEGVANLQKVTGLAKDEARDLAKELIKIDTRTSVSALLELATAGGRLGLKGRELIDFTKNTDKAFVALGDSLTGTAEEIGLELGKIAGVFGVEKKFGIGEAINKVGSSLNELGAKSKAQEGNIQDFTNRLAGVGSAAGLTIPEVQSLGALFDESGQSIEVAATTLNQLLPAIGKDVKRFAKIAGKDIREFEKLVSEKPFEALKAVALGAKSSQGGLIGLSKTLENYGVESARSAGIVTLLSEKTDRLTELQELANKAFDEGTSLSDEFAVKNQTLAAEIEKLGNNWDKFIISLDGSSSVIGNVSKNFINFLNGAIKGMENLDLITKSAIDGLIKFREDELSRTLEGGWVTETGVNINKIREEFDKIPLKSIAKDVDKVRETWIDLLGEDRTDAALLFTQYIKDRFKAEKELTATTIELGNATDTTSGINDKAAESTRILTGLIEKQSKVISDLQEQIQRATIEEEIFSLGFDLDKEEEELNRLKRLYTSTLEEIRQIEIDQIKDSTERTIAAERVKTDKTIELIRTNSRITSEERERLAKIEEAKFDAFAVDAQIKKGTDAINREANLQKALFEQRRTGFSTEEEFEKEKVEQFKAIEIKALKEELELLKEFGDDSTKLRQEQIKARLEGLNDMGKGLKNFEDLIGQSLEAIADLVDDAFEKRIEAIGNQIDKTSERADQLRKKANAGQLASEESLAFEQKKEAELEKQREREQKRRERTQAFFSVLASFNANNGDLGKTIADVGVLRALAGTLSAYDGVDDTGGRGDIDSKGGKIWTLHPNEQVWSKKDRSEVGFRNRDEIKDIVKMYDNGFLTDMMRYDKSNEMFNANSLILNGLGSKEMISKMNQLNQSIKNIQIPEGTVDIDQVRGLITIISKKGNKVTREISKLHK